MAPKAAAAKRRVKLTRSLEFTATLPAAALGAIAALDGFAPAAAWLPVATTLSQRWSRMLRPRTMRMRWSATRRR
jgi:hypothetical protein